MAWAWPSPGGWPSTAPGPLALVGPDRPRRGAQRAAIAALRARRRAGASLSGGRGATAAVRGARSAERGRLPAAAHRHRACRRRARRRHAVQRRCRQRFARVMAPKLGRLEPPCRASSRAVAIARALLVRRGACSGSRGRANYAAATPSSTRWPSTGGRAAQAATEHQLGPVGRDRPRGRPVPTAAIGWRRGVSRTWAPPRASRPSLGYSPPRPAQVAVMPLDWAAYAAA